MQVQVLVAAKEIKDKITRYKEGRSFTASLNAGGYGVTQFAILLIDLDTHSIVEIHPDLVDGGEHISYDCTVIPIDKTPVKSQTERRLDPEL